MKKWHKILVAIAVYEIAAYAWNNYSGSTTVLPGDLISKVL